MDCCAWLLRLLHLAWQPWPNYCNPCKFCHLTANVQPTRHAFVWLWKPQVRPSQAHDTLIAATALRYQATLITRNVREFSRVPGLQWLNWHQD